MNINSIIINKKFGPKGQPELEKFSKSSSTHSRTRHPFHSPKLDGDWANIDGLLFNPPDPIKIDDACCCWIADGGRISNADELVGTMLT